MNGKWNMVSGLWGIAAFMVYGFILVYMRDFAPDAAEWAASYGTGKHFEARLAHVHGALFSFLNIVIGFLLLKLPLKAGVVRFVSISALLGIMMPLGILAEIYLGASPVFVLVGGASMLASVAVFGFGLLRSDEAALRQKTL
jgi:hypothetical protein